MAHTEVFFFREPKDSSVPLLKWLDDLPSKAQAKCTERIDRLAELGHELRRPEADFLRDGIYELRIRKGRVNFRILFFFHGKNVAILGHALTKETTVPNVDIERAIRRRKAFEADPAKHSYSEEEKIRS